MALTDNRTQLQDCQALAEVAGQGTADPQTDTAEAGFVIQGAGSLQFQVTNAQEYVTYDQDSAGATFSIDLSDSTVYIMIKDNLSETFANLGGQIVLCDGADAAGGDCIGYNVGGNDVGGLPYEKRYHGFKLDVSVVVATPGTNNVDYFQYVGTEAGLNHAAILQVGYGSIHLAKAQGTVPNAWFDGIYYIANGSYGASITGGTTGTPETMADLSGDDVTVGAGLFSNPIGASYYIFAPTEWGAATGDTAFAGTDEQWFYLGDNGGGHSIGAGNFFMRLLGGTGTNIFRQTRVVNVNVGSRADFDWSHASFDEITLTATTWVQFGVITCPGVDVDKNLNNATFNDCDQVIMNGMNMDVITFNGAFNANGAVLLDTAGDSNNASNVTFVSDGTGHAITITATGAYNFDNWIFSGFGADATANAAVRNNSGGVVTINVLNNGGTPTVLNVTTSTTTINNSVTVTMDGMVEGTACKVLANETVGTITSGDTLGEGLTNSAGVFSFTLNYEGAFGAGLDVIANARNQGLPNAAIADDNGVFTNQTTAANSAATGDMNLLPVTPVVNEDGYYFGHREQFGGLKINISTAGTGGFTITWQYWNGAWVSLSGVTDGTSSFSVLGINYVTWTIPGDWATTTINSQGPFYFVRARYTAGTVTVTPLGRSATLDVTRYLPFTQNRTITASGLTVTVPQTVDQIAEF